jgi:hypothetical protein
LATADRYWARSLGAAVPKTVVGGVLIRAKMADRQFISDGAFDL